LADEVTLRITAEVTQALREVVKLRNEYLKVASEFTQAFANVNKAYNQFSGDRIIRQSQAIIQAIREVGGASKLTADESRQANRVLEEALAKYAALGQRAPKALRELFEATRQVTAATKSYAKELEQVSGTKTITHALNYVKAVREIGGASKLTAADTRAVSAAVNEAIAKYQALGRTAPTQLIALQKATQGLSATQREINRLYAEFSGSKTISAANNMAAAVARVGSAAKLTESEQRRVNQVVTEAVAKYQALGQQAPAALQKLADETKKLAVETSKIGTEATKTGAFFDRAFFRLTGAITLADLAAQAVVKTLGFIKDSVTGIISTVIELGAQGSKVQMISEGFFRLQNAIGQLGGRTIEVAREKTRGLITDFDLMRQANRAMLFGLEVTPEKFGLLGEAAIKLGRAMGIEAPRAMDDLVLALGRVSPRILDNLGIIVKVGEANREWAKAHHTTVEAMTAANRVQAFYEMSLKKIEEHLKNLGDFTLTLSDRMQIMQVHWTNWVNKLALAVNLSPVLREALFHIGTLFSQTFGKTSADNISRIVGLIEDVAIFTVRAAEALVPFGRVSLQVLAGVLKGWNEFSLLLSQTSKGLAAVVRDFAAAREVLSFGNARRMWRDMRTDAELFIMTQDGLIERNKQALKTSIDWANGQGKLFNALDQTGQFLKQLRENMERAKKEQADYSTVVDGTITGLHKWESTEDELNQTLEAGSKQRDALLKKTAELAAALEMAEKNGVPAATVIKEYGAAITDVSNRSQVFGTAVPDSINRWVDAMEKALPVRDKFIKNVENLERVLQLLPKDIPFEEVLREFGAAIQDANDRSHAFNLKVPAMVASWSDSFRAYRETLANIKQGNEDLEAHITKMGEVQERMLSLKTEFDKKYFKLMDNGREDRLALLDTEYEEAMAKLGPMVQGFETEWMEAASAIGRAHVAATDKVKSTWGSTITELTKTLPQALLSAFSGGGNVMNTISAAIGNVLGPKLFSMEGGGLGKKMSDALTGGSAGGGIASKAGLLGGIARGVLNMIPLIGPIIGMLAGPIAKGIKRLFTGPSMEKKVAADLGREYGQAFSDGLIDKITADAKRLGDRMAATGLHLKAVIEEAGGVTTANVNKWIAKTRDLFVFLERGIITSEEAAKSLNEVIPDLAKTFEKAGGMWNSQFRELIDLTKREGLEIQAVTDLLDAQVTKLAGGTTKVIDGFADKIIKLGEAANSANANLEGGLFGKAGEDAFKTGGNYVKGLTKEIFLLEAEIKDLKDKDKLGELTRKQRENLSQLEEKLKTLQHQFKGLSQTQKEAAEQLDKIAKEGQVEFDRLNRITLRTFNAMVAEGKSPVEAIDAIGASVDKLAKVQEILGLNGSKAFDKLKRWRELVEINRPLLEQAQGLNDILVASINLRALDAEGFADLQAQGLETYAKLKAAGFTESESLQQMKGFLESVILAHEERGEVIDDETAKLIAQAREEGIIKDKQITTNDILMEGLGAIIKAVGGDLPEAWKKMGNEAEIQAKRAAQAAEEAHRKVKDVSGALDRAEGQWQDWGDAAVDAARDAQAAVDGVSFGSSPGGLKEWSPLLNKSRKDMLAFARDGSLAMDSLINRMKLVPELAPEFTADKLGINRVLEQSDSIARQTAIQGAGMVWNGDMNIKTFTLGEEIEMIKKKLAPGVLGAVHDGGKTYEHFESLVRGVRR
jgi:hypothetical protein